MKKFREDCIKDLVTREGFTVNDSSIEDLTHSATYPPTNAFTKYDQQKNRLDLIPCEAIEGLGNALTFGANKYGANNWRSGTEWSRFYGAAQRHMWAWWAGEGTDPESGLSHLDHALCCLAFLITYEKAGVGENDRPGGA